MKTILEALSGSHAYGLATPQSDEDLRGIFVAPTLEILGLHKVSETVNTKDPDSCYHEVGKFIRLALECNPTLLELLFMEEYRVLSPEGNLLIENRDCFLSNRVFSSYGGYAISQARQLKARGGKSFDSDVNNRYAKHGRHCFRLLAQGKELLETGTLTVKVSNREELVALGDLEPAALVEKFEEEFALFEQVKSVLPETPDVERANRVLLFIRDANFLRPSWEEPFPSCPNS